MPVSAVPRLLPPAALAATRLLVSHHARAGAGTIAVALDVGGRCAAHVALGQLELAVDVRLVHLVDAAHETRYAVAVVAPRERLLDDADALLARSVLDEPASGQRPPSLRRSRALGYANLPLDTPKSLGTGHIEWNELVRAALDSDVTLWFILNREVMR